MAIDVNVEDLVPFNRTGDWWPVNPPPHISAGHRWRLHGLKRGDRVVRLETVMVGGRRYTSTQAVTRFIEALNADQPAAVDGPTATRRAKDAGRALAAVGC